MSNHSGEQPATTHSGQPWHAPAEELARRWQLAEQVHAELIRAGLPASLASSLSAPSKTGAEVDVDPSDDSLGGVTVDWRTERSLSDAAVDALLAQRLSDAAFLQYGVVTESMNVAMSAILKSAGFILDSGDDVNDLSPSMIYVFDSQSMV